MAQTIHINRTFDFLENYKHNFPNKDVLACKIKGKWIRYTIEEYIYQVNLVSQALLALGLSKGDKIATISNNRPEWNFIDLGSAQIGVIHVPIYSNICDDDLKHIVNHSEVKAAFISCQEYYNQLYPFFNKSTTLQYIFSFDDIEGVKSFKDLISLGINSESQQGYLNKIKKRIDKDDLVSLIYTSGSTGTPKGVMLTHENFTSNAIAVAKLHHLDSKHKVLSFLPLSHIYERTFHYSYLYLGINIYYAEGLHTIVDNLQELKVHGFLTVPRVLEKIYDRFISAGKQLPTIKKIVFFWAVRLGLQYNFGKKRPFYSLRLKIADQLVFKRLREVLGNNILFIGCGGASLQNRLERIYHAAKIPVYVGYGLTETSPVVSVNYGKSPNIRFRSVGKPMDICRVNIANDKEILIKGPNVMQGYYKDEEKTKEAFTNEGWFRTGDLGMIDKKGFLHITGRKKEIFKTSGGKYIAPTKLENKLKESFFIDTALIIGENKHFPAALLIPNFIYLQDWCNVHNIKDEDNQRLIKHPKVIERFKKEVDICNRSLGQYERIKKFLIISDEWSTPTGEITPTLKLKRKFIAKKYRKQINEIYDIKNTKESYPKKIKKGFMSKWKK